MMYLTTGSAFDHCLHFSVDPHNESQNGGMGGASSHAPHVCIFYRLERGSWHYLQCCAIASNGRASFVQDANDYLGMVFK